MVKENEMIMMTEKEYEEIKGNDSKVKELEVANEMLRKALFKLTSKMETSDVRVSRKDFLKMYNEALDYMFNHDDEENDIYGYEVTVHWHGMYCSCSDGATPSNCLIPAIEGCDEELDPFDV
jgi:hypothetical protein